MGYVHVVFRNVRILYENCSEFSVNNNGFIHFCMCERRLPSTRPLIASVAMEWAISIITCLFGFLESHRHITITSLHFSLACLQIYRLKVYRQLFTVVPSLNSKSKDAKVFYDAFRLALMN
jgi:hypothetical protein